MGGGARWCPLSGGDEPERLSAKGGGGKGRGEGEGHFGDTHYIHTLLRLEVRRYSALHRK